MRRTGCVGETIGLHPYDFALPDKSGRSAWYCKFLRSPGTTASTVCAKGWSPQGFAVPALLGQAGDLEA
jgi:hypothetical protein